MSIVGTDNASTGRTFNSTTTTDGGTTITIGLSATTVNATIRAEYAFSRQVVGRAVGDDCSY